MEMASLSKLVVIATAFFLSTACSQIAGNNNMKNDHNKVEQEHETEKNCKTCSINSEYSRFSLKPLLLDPQRKIKFGCFDAINHTKESEEERYSLFKDKNYKSESKSPSLGTICHPIWWLKKEPESIDGVINVLINTENLSKKMTFNSSESLLAIIYEIRKLLVKTDRRYNSSYETQSFIKTANENTEAAVNNFRINGVGIKCFFNKNSGEESLKTCKFFLLKGSDEIIRATLPNLTESYHFSYEKFVSNNNPNEGALIIRYPITPQNGSNAEIVEKALFSLVGSYSNELKKFQTDHNKNLINHENYSAKIIELSAAFGMGFMRVHPFQDFNSRTLWLLNFIIFPKLSLTPPLFESLSCFEIEPMNGLIEAYRIGQMNYKNLMKNKVVHQGDSNMQDWLENIKEIRSELAGHEKLISVCKILESLIDEKEQ